jgi:uncharacterized RDD family membrane protein YckC
MPDAPLSRPAGLLRRLGAMAYDGILVLAVWLVTLAIAVAFHHGVAVVNPALSSLLFVEWFAYFTYSWVRRGQTVGMLAWQLRLESDLSAPLRPGQALLRFIGALLSFGLGGIGYLWMYIDPDRRTWPDILSRTHVVHLPLR